MYSSTALSNCSVRESITAHMNASASAPINSCPHDAVQYQCHAPDSVATSPSKRCTSASRSFFSFSLSTPVSSCLPSPAPLISFSRVARAMSSTWKADSRSSSRSPPAAAPSSSSSSSLAPPSSASSPAPSSPPSSLPSSASPPKWKLGFEEGPAVLEPAVAAAAAATEEEEPPAAASVALAEEPFVAPVAAAAAASSAPGAAPPRTALWAMALPRRALPYRISGSTFSGARSPYLAVLRWRYTSAELLRPTGTGA